MTELRLRRALLLRGIARHFDNPRKLIDAVSHAGIVREPALGLLHDMRRQWGIAVSTEPLGKEAADAALNAARHVLATVAVEDAAKNNKRAA